MTAVESTFSVATGNKYGFLFDDAEDPDEILRIANEEKKDPKVKVKKVKEAKAPVTTKSDEKPPQKSEGADGSARRGRRNQDGKNAIPRFSGDRDAGNDQQQRPPSRGFGSNRGFGRRQADDESGQVGIEEGNRGRGRGRGGDGRGRGRGEGRGGFSRGSGENRGRGRGFGQRGGFGQKQEGDADQSSEVQQQGGGGFGRGRGGFNRGGFAPRPSHEGDEAVREDDVEGGEENRPRGRGRGGFNRGNRGGRGGTGGGFGRGRGREYERHSGSAATGVKPVDKKDGGGAHNWGSAKDEIDEQLKAEGEPAKDQDWAEAVEQETAAEGGNEQQNEKMMTLEEWKKQQAEDRAKLQSGKVDQGRKVDTSGFKEMTAYRKERIDEHDDEEDEEEHSTAQMIVKKSEIETSFFYKNKQSQANYDDRRRGRGGRGGRGRGDSSRGAEPPRGGGGSRGRGGRGGPSGGFGGGSSGGNPEFRVDDKDFPGLN